MLSLRSGRREQRSLALAAGGSAGQDGACPQATAGVRRTTRVSRCPQRTVRSRPQGAAKQTHRSGRGVKPERAPSTAGTGSSVQPGQRSGGNVASASVHIRDCQVRSRVQMPGRFHRILHGRAPLFRQPKSCAPCDRSGTRPVRAWRVSGDDVTDTSARHGA